MRVACPTFDEFLTCLQADRDKGVWHDTVRYSIVRLPFSGDRKEPKKEVTIQISVVMQSGEDGSEYLLEVGEHCGFNYEDSSQEFEGDRVANSIKDKLTEICDDLNLRLLPGIIHA